MIGLLGVSVLLSVTGLSVARLSVSAASATSAVPLSAASTVNDCATPAPGYAQCFSIKVNTPVSPPSTSGVRPFTATPATTPLGPADLASAYSLDQTRGSGETVAIVDAYNDANAESDLAAYRAGFNLPACTTANGCFRKVNQTGAASPLPAANSGWAQEISLDVDMVSAVCPQCNILLVEANSSSNLDLAAAVDEAVALGAKFVSNSYGSSDSSGMDSHYNHPGVVMTASSGDNGYGVAFPASAPTVTAVGGTNLVRASNARGWTETAWSGAGSGCSTRQAQPSYQANVVTSCAGRAVADVSAVASPSTPVYVYNGGWEALGGTSASSPIIAAVYALAGVPGASDYPNTYLYAHTDGLNDVTSGSNGSCGGSVLCTSGAGWDGPTGLGTPNGLAAFTASGVIGARTTLGATATVTSPVIPGLPTPATVTALLPASDSVASIAWTSALKTCVFSAPTAASTNVSCPVKSSGSTTVTATVKDTAGATKIVTMPLAFNTTAPKRTLAVSVGVTGQSGGSQSVCAGANTAIKAVVTDTATGAPVLGVPVGFTRTAAGKTANLATGASDATGSAASVLNTAVAVTLTAKSAAIGGFNAFTGSALAVTAAKCSPSLTATKNVSASYYGDAVTVSGSLTRSTASGTAPVSAAPLQVVQTLSSTGKTVLLGKAVTAADGSYSVAVAPTASGTIAVNLLASAAWNAATASAGTLTVSTPATSLAGTKSADHVTAGTKITVSGTLQRVAGSTTTAVVGGAVVIKSTSTSGAVTTLGTAKVAAGTWNWTVTVTVKAAGTLSGVYAGKAGQPAATVNLGALTTT